MKKFVITVIAVVLSFVVIAVVFTLVGNYFFDYPFVKMLQNKYLYIVAGGASIAIMLFVLFSDIGKKEVLKENDYLENSRWLTCTI